MKADVRIFENLDVLSRAAAESFIEAAGQAIMDRGRFLVALSGGSTPLTLYRLLAQSPTREQIDWRHVQAFWGDERCVPPEDLENTYWQVREALLRHVPIPNGNVHRIQSDLAPQAAADAYAVVLKEYSTPPLEWPCFDLVLLGMGTDGHTASIFPGSAVNAASPTLAVAGQYQDRPAQRVTLTPLVFNSARRIVFLVSGGGKRDVLASVLSAEHRPEILPAQRIRPTDGELIWMVDEAAAGKL
jgi:6-phosphogluconolactonase